MDGFQKKDFVTTFAAETDAIIETTCGGLKWKTKEMILTAEE